MGFGVIVALLFKRCVTRMFPRMKGNIIDRALLAVLSLSLLCYQSLLTLLIFLFVMVVTYFSLMYIRHLPLRYKRLGLASLVTLQFMPLLYYKYASFISNDLFGVENEYFSRLMIPVGISFYTFQMVGFVIDYYRSHEDYPRFLDCLNFASFFPQIVAGPVERKERLLPQVQKFRFSFSLENLEKGCKWVVLGLFLKLALADNLASAVPWILLPSENPYAIWLGSFVFGLRIYFDFAGYSLIALGLGRLFGIELILNFFSPYSASNIQEFWHRWHISLSTWFRDYLYFPLGGSRSWHWALNIMVVFVVSGIWHGSGWNYILWGAAHGILLILYRLMKPLHGIIPSCIAWAINLFFITLIWLFFYQTDTIILLSKLTTLVSIEKYGIKNIFEIRYLFVSLGNLINALVWVSLSLMVIGVEFISLKRYGNPYALACTNLLNVIMAAFTIVVSPVVQNSFIYFNF